MISDDEATPPHKRPRNNPPTPTPTVFNIETEASSSSPLLLVDDDDVVTVVKCPFASGAVSSSRVHQENFTGKLFKF